eukprot:762792-Hanusia_phi.AAC.2
MIGRNAVVMILATALAMVGEKGQAVRGDDAGTTVGAEFFRRESRWSHNLPLRGSSCTLRAEKNAVQVLRDRGGEDQFPQVCPEDETTTILTEDGLVQKQIMQPGWLSPDLSVGDELSVVVVGTVYQQPHKCFLNRTVNDPLVFKYGKREVVSGLEIGIASMKQGERAKFIVRGPYGYGADPPWEVVRPFAPLEFDVTLLCWGQRDLTEGRGGVLFTEIQRAMSWQFPEQLDDVKVDVKVGEERGGGGRGGGGGIKEEEEEEARGGRGVE